ncbi:MAG: carboxylesterase [Pseudomonadota bacterium]
MTEYLPAVEIEPATSAKASVIWLHGLGADGHDFEPIVPALKIPAAMAVRFILPHAPSLPVTVNNGIVMPAWYDIIRFGEEREFNRAQLEASANAVHALIEREIERGVPANRIVLAGFSQGGAVCYHAALTYAQRLGGVLGLSTYFPTHDLPANAAQAGLPIMICHGTVDMVVPMVMGRNSVRHLETYGLSPEYKAYHMAHQVCPEEIDDIAGFIRKCLPTA